MDTVKMNMSSYNIEHETHMLEEYGVEVMFAGWNPQLALASERAVAQIDRHVTLLAVLANVDVDAFLQSMYDYQ